MVQQTMQQGTQQSNDSLESREHDYDVNHSHQDKAAFFQLTGHKECFKRGTKSSTILKLSTGNEEACLSELMNDILAPFVPKLIANCTIDEKKYLEMENLLIGFQNASVMDVKMGCRTYQEEELDLATKEKKLRPDMYDKMVEIDEKEPTVEERKMKAITKPRYMVWRETISSTASLSFRIEGMRLSDGTVDKDFKLIKKEEQIVKSLMRYARGHKIRLKYLNRLYDLKRALIQSKFFKTHELIGSSLLFVHDDFEANIWMIDFAKTRPLPSDTTITHRKKWEIGNHEDGYLNGVENLIRIFESILSYRAIEHLNSDRADQVNNQKKKPNEKVIRSKAILPRMSLSGSRANGINGTIKRLLLS